MTTHRGHSSDLRARCSQSSEKLHKHLGLLLRVAACQIARHLAHISVSDCEVQRRLACCVPVDQAAIVELGSSGPDTADQSNVHALAPIILRSHPHHSSGTAHSERLRRVTTADLTIKSAAWPTHNAVRTQEAVDSDLAIKTHASAVGKLPSTRPSRSHAGSPSARRERRA